MTDESTHSAAAAYGGIGLPAELSLPTTPVTAAFVVTPVASGPSSNSRGGTAPSESPGSTESTRSASSAICALLACSTAAAKMCSASSSILVEETRRGAMSSYEIVIAAQRLEWAFHDLVAGTAAEVASRESR